MSHVIEAGSADAPAPVGGIIRPTSVWRMVGIGLALGAVWGAVLRVWMRFITTNPEFSWSGTLMIVGVSAIAGAVLGLARHRRLSGGVGWWRYSILALLLLGGAGSVMWPSVIVGGLAVGRPGPRWLRIAAAIGAVGLQIPVVMEVAVDNPLLTPVEATVAIAWYAVMLAIEVWAFSVVFAPAVEGAPRPTVAKKVAFALPFVGFALLAVVMMGLVG